MGGGSYYVYLKDSCLNIKTKRNQVRVRMQVTCEEKAGPGVSSLSFKEHFSMIHSLPAPSPSLWKCFNFCTSKSVNSPGAAATPPKKGSSNTDAWNVHTQLQQRQ